MKFTPFLKSAGWVQKSAGKGVLTAPLVDAAQKLGDDVPVISYGVDQGDTVGYLRDNFLKDVSFSEVHQKALASLRAVLANTEWLEVSETVSNMELRFLVFTNNFHAAECLLLQERMREAHALLGSARLLACTPERGLLLVSPYDGSNKASLDAFVDICLKNFQVEGNEKISPVIWGVEDGIIRDRMKVHSPIAVEVSPLSERLSKDTQGANYYYTPAQIGFVTLFGTVLAGLYGIGANYKVMGNLPAYHRTIGLGCVLVPLFFVSLVLLPRTPIDRLFPVIAALLLGMIAHILQGTDIKLALTMGGKRQRVWRQVVVIAMSLLLLLPLLAFFISR